MSRIERLLSRMTLAEKLGQLTMTAAHHATTGPVIAGDSTEAIRSGAIGSLLNLVGADAIHELQRVAVEESRLGIPLLLGFDVLHGHRIQFPIPLGETAVFDPGVWERTAREAAREATADGLALTFAPMLDVSRDPRWGRSAEGPGEDPFVAARLAQAKVRGFQGARLAAADAIAACAKHYCAYGPVTAGRDYASVDISERTLHEVHLPPFEAAVRAGVATIMPAFTDLAGMPMTAHRPLLRGHLRERLGFEGVLISDYNAIAELMRHGIAADLAEAAALALEAGVDIDMMSDAFRRGLPEALRRRRARMADIDAAVRRVLRLKESLGLFADPYRRGARPESAAVVRRRRRLAREVAARAMVLLQNEADVLPLAPGISRIAVMGPLADAPAEMRGPWSAAAGNEGHVSVLQGLREAFPGARIEHAAGVPLREVEEAGIEAAAALCDGAEVIILCVGEAAGMSGEAASRTQLGLPGSQPRLARAVFERARARGIPVITVLFSGRPLIVPELVEHSAALIAAWFPGSEAGSAIADLLTGRRSPEGRTPLSWPRQAGQIPVFFGQRPSGRPAHPDDGFTSKYLDSPNEPQFPFGHGLTYGRFEHADLVVSPARVRPASRLRIRLTVRNTGRRTATDTVFLFARDPLASVARPLLELKGFTKVRLRPGERRRIGITLAAAELRFHGASLEPVWEPGEVEILAGPCADRRRLLSTKVQLLPSASRK
ncbi:MAG: glycoside hydrolase family 3 N-terminal domain-containing protein [Steroidobacteraceae bacterium]